MYVPPAFRVENDDRALALVDEYPFATLIATENGRPSVNHLPLLLLRDPAGKHRLIGHMAKKNPQWRLFEGGASAFAVFHGPHTYVTPTWYQEHDVPTWNYAVVHVAGRVRLVQDFKGLTQILGKLSARFESREKAPWRFYLPDDLNDEAKLTGAIVGFEIEGLEIQAKFKLNQNRSEADQEGVRAGLAGRTDEMSLKVREMMLPK